MSGQGRIRSQVSEAYRILRGGILSGSFAPGNRLSPAELSERLGLGATPIREALARLSAENLAIAIEQRGFRVAPLNLDELQELLGLRLHFEREAIHHSMRSGDENWEARIVAAFHLLQHCEAPHEGQAERDFVVWSQRHDGFHHALLSGCDRAWLTRFHQVTMEQIERYRVAILSARHLMPDGDATGSELRALLSLEEHQRLRDAILSRDMAEADAALNTHIGRTEALFCSQFAALNAITPT